MIKTITVSLALTTAALWSLTGCEDSREPAKHSKTTSAPAEETNPNLPMLKTPIVVTTPAPATEAAEPAAHEPATTPEAEAVTEPLESASAEPAAEEAPAAPEVTETDTSTETPASESAEAQTTVASRPEPTLSDVLIQEAEKAGWKTHRDSEGNVFVVPPGTPMPSE